MILICSTLKVFISDLIPDNSGQGAIPEANTAIIESNSIQLDR